MFVRDQGDLRPTPVDQALLAVGRGLARAVEQGGAIAGVLSPFLTVEEAYSMSSYLKGLSAKAVLALGPVPRVGHDVTFSPDLVQGRCGDTSFIVPRPFTIHAEKCPNRRGVEAILEHFQGAIIGFDAFCERAAKGEFAAVYVASDAIDPWIDEPAAQGLRAGTPFLVVQDTNVTPLAQRADVVLAGATFAEKAGCYENADGRIQYAEAALPPRDGALPDLDLFAILLGKAAGPIRSRDVLKEVAERVPAFAAAQGGEVPAFGRKLDATASQSETAFPFSDSWTLTRQVDGSKKSLAHAL
jgi:NADH-quinone oxidoreductase subunit G